jgi:transcriptional regulator with XRE-family HTH domain
MDNEARNALLTEAGHRLRVARTTAGLTVTDVAAHVGTSRDSISAYEAGRREPSLLAVIKMLELYRSCGVVVDNFFDDLADRTSYVVRYDAEYDGRYNKA